MVNPFFIEWLRLPEKDKKNLTYEEWFKQQEK